jgi:short subunit fatty acids transporter
MIFIILFIIILLLILFFYLIMKNRDERIDKNLNNEIKKEMDMLMSLSENERMQYINNYNSNVMLLNE